MKPMHVALLSALAVSAMAWAEPAFAQPAGQTLTLTLEDAVTRGLAESHRVEEASARQEAAAAAIDARRSVGLPQVAAIAGYSRTSHVDEFGVPLPNGQLRVIYPDIPDNYRARLDVQWPVYTGGRLEALTAAAGHEANALGKDVDALRSDLRLDITRAFWSLVVADESLRVVNESLARMGAHLTDVQNQLSAGLIPPNDVLTVRAQESRQRMLSIQQRAARDVAEADLARLVGAPAGASIRPDAVLMPANVDRTFDALFAQAQEQRKDRQALHDRLAGADRQQAAALASKRPTIALSGGVDYARPNPRIFPRAGAWKEFWDAGINVNWPLFDGGRAKADTAQASATRRALQSRLEEFDSLLALEIRQRLAEIEASKAAIAAADDGIAAATEARRVVGERFTAGVATSTDVLDAQLAVLQANLDRTQAMANSRLADARLHRALGE